MGHTSPHTVLYWYDTMVMIMISIVLSGSL